MQPSEEIKQKLDIVEFIREYMELTPAGVNFKARCPFHKESTPSFVVSPDKQIWHCFGCGKGGDVFSFLMEMENVDFVEALKILAPKAGVALKKQDPKKVSERNRLLELMDLSRRFYHKVLTDSPAAKNAWNYLLDRGLSEDTIEGWQIGYAPDTWDTLINFLRGRGFSNQEMLRAGLSAQSSLGKGDYDRFRGRIMFPINDINGNTVAFSARISPDKEGKDKMGKYVNSPQSAIYDKSKIIFGLDRAKQPIRQSGAAIVVEGQMDVITAHQSGFDNVVASSGTALTGEQVALIKRFTPNLYLAFDRDQAGIAAAERVMVVASQAGMNVKVITVPNGKDPDDCIRENPSAWETAVKEAKPMMGFYIDSSLFGLDMGNIDHRREAIKRIMPKIYLLSDKIDQDYWLRVLSDRTDTPEDVLREVFKGIAPPARAYQAPARPEPARPPVLGRQESLSELLLALLLRFSFLTDYAIRQMELNFLSNEKNISLYKNIILYYNNSNSDEAIEAPQISANNSLYTRGNLFRQWLENLLSAKSASDSLNQLMHFDKLVILSEKEFFELDNESAKLEAVKLIKELKRNYLVNRRREITALIGQSSGNEEEAAALMQELKDLNDEIKDIGA